MENVIKLENISNTKIHIDIQIKTKQQITGGVHEEKESREIITIKRKRKKARREREMQTRRAHERREKGRQTKAGAGRDSWKKAGGQDNEER